MRQVGMIRNVPHQTDMVLRLHGYTAWIEVEGRQVEEHAIEVTDSTVSCYICSEDGLRFTLLFGDDGLHPFDAPQPYGRSIQITMDGKSANVEWGHPLQTIRSGGVRSRYYRFGTVQTTCDDEVAPVVDPDKAAIGTIQVDLIRVRYREVRDRWATSTEVELNPGLVHERSEKAGMHRIILGPPAFAGKTFEDDWEGVDDQPYITFLFRYLPAGALRAQLAARQPKRTPGPSSQVAGGADAGASKRKREDGDVIDVTSSEDSEEDTPSPPKRRVVCGKGAKGERFTNGTRSPASVIDLT